MAIKSVLSIVLFLVTYIILVALGLGVILLCGLIAYALVTLKAMFITLMLGLGFIGMGFLIFFFLIKFIFSSPAKVDRSHLLEVTAQEQPQLFHMIREIVEEVKTDFPKKVYLSSDVNASVFYDSNFWSMFFPVRKNLQIGLGLMNAVSATELKAILAHEFGHFSQRSMKVGSYVYNVNKVIYNMLYDNDSYHTMLSHWSGASSYFALFARGAILVVQGIQYVLIKVYRILNLNYMALSREMEFHADAVAASVAGSLPLASALLRLNLAEQSLNSVFNYYNHKLSAAQKTSNFYPQQSFIIEQIALTEGLPLQDGLPHLSVEVYKKFNKTKLVLEDQWSSHPSTEQRVAQLMALNLPLRESSKSIAIDLLSDKNAVQETITAKLFGAVSFETEPGIIGPSAFYEDYLKQEQENGLPPAFKGFFDHRDPYHDFSDTDFSGREPLEKSNLEDLINDQSAAEINSLSAAISDKTTIEGIYNGNFEIKTFDYDGTKYSASDAQPLISFLETEITRLTAALAARDVSLFRLFLDLAATQNKLNEFQRHAFAFQEVAVPMQAQHDAYINLSGATYFMHTSTPFSQITENMLNVKRLEGPFKEQVRQLLEHPSYKDLIDGEMRSRFEEYLDKDWKYFGYEVYFDQEVDALFKVMSDFSTTIFKLHTQLKRSWLNFNASLIRQV